MKKLLLIFALGCIVICAVVGLTACNKGSQHSVVCLDCDNGYVITSDAQAEAGRKVILAAHPSAGYKLTALFVDGEALDGVSFVMPDKDVTVSAQFEPITYSITYVLGDATLTGDNPETYTVENPVELIDPYKEGYEVCGWYRYHTESEYDFDVENYRVINLDELYGDLTLYAYYYNPLHAINILDGDGGWGYIEEGDYYAYYGDTLNVAVETNYGYELDYITVNGERIDGTTFTMPKRDVEIVIEYKVVTYSISYVLNGGVNSPNNPTSYTLFDDYVQFEDAYKEGYVFVGWCLDEELEDCLYDSKFYLYDGPRDLTLYALFVVDDGEIDEEIL